uniref:DNA-directed RNA polymerase RBP11-like dimerisation domain-containing protein n=1 Tax=viral metagenome TaxID=1070528 RepID=A0A6C0LSV7_9ZZZZ
MATSDIIDSDSKNDSIDIYGIPDVNCFKIPLKKDTDFGIEISGKNIDYSIVNSIRQSIMKYVPIYGFHRSHVTIDSRTRVMYNYDMIYGQIEMLPIFDLDNNFDLEDPELFLPDEVMKHIFGKFIPEKYSNYQEDDKKVEPIPNKKLHKIEISVNYKNSTDSHKYLSTHDLNLRINEKNLGNYIKHTPINILVVKSGEEIAFKAEANLGIATISSIYEATTNAYHKEINSSKYELYYTTLGQLTNDVIFTKACTILIKKLEHLSIFIEGKYKKEPSTKTMEIELYGEDYTLGNLLATALQKCNFIKAAGCDMSHLFKENITIRYKLNSGTKIGQIKLLLDIINYLINLLREIIKRASESKYHKKG